MTPRDKFRVPLASRAVALVASLLALVLLTHCSAVQTIPQRDGRPMGYLHLEVQPESAEVEIDEKYAGRIDGWVAQTIPVSAGLRKVTIRAPGYITQRFDIEVNPGEEVTLELHMEPSFEDEAARSDLTPTSAR